MNARQQRLVQLEAQTCPRRMGEFGPWQHDEGLDHWERGRWAATQAEADAEVAEFMAAHPTGSIGHVLWSYGGEQPRTCSFCGGVHPDDAAALIRAGWEVDGTDKWYKRYLEPPGYRASCARFFARGLAGVRDAAANPDAPVHSPVPPVKLYVQHFNDEQIVAFNTALAERQEKPA